jgi:hypothetical protein
VTRDRAKKKAIRARMAASGEPYSVAARGLDAAPADGAALVREVIARANATLAAPSVRFEYRRDVEAGAAPLRLREPARPGPVGRLARRALGAAWQRIAPGVEVDVGEVGEALLHQTGAGFLEPAAGRYQIDYGAYAQIYNDGALFGGQPGATLGPRNRDRRARQPRANDPLEVLGRLCDVTDARQSAVETLRGRPCRVVTVQAGPDERTVWIDDEYVRRIRIEWRNLRGNGSAVQVFELWDFGVPVDSLDWSRLPRFGESG